VRRGNDDDLALGGTVTSAPVEVPEVRIEVCRCGCTGGEHAVAAPPPPEPEWPLATAWSWLTRPSAAQDDDGLLEDDDEEPDPADLPWWDARASASKRRAVLPLVLLGELQAGVLLRAVWEVVRAPGPQA
jgi:hypothetical protein